MPLEASSKDDWLHTDETTSDWLNKLTNHVIMYSATSASWDKTAFAFHFLDVLCALKVGSWSFEGIIILLIYFLNCWKALFTKQYASFSKKGRVKSIRSAIL